MHYLDLSRQKVSCRQAASQREQLCFQPSRQATIELTMCRSSGSSGFLMQSTPSTTAGARWSPSSWWTLVRSDVLATSKRTSREVVSTDCLMVSRNSMARAFARSNPSAMIRGCRPSCRNLSACFCGPRVLRESVCARPGQCVAHTAGTRTHQKLADKNNGSCRAVACNIVLRRGCACYHRRRRILDLLVGRKQQRQRTSVKFPHQSAEVATGSPFQTEACGRPSSA
jgi:hypothetical protein